MTLDLFSLLSPEVQLHYVHTQGVFLAWRWEGESPTMLYYLADTGRGFFVELGADAEQTHFVVLRSFSDSEALTDYAEEVRLPEG